MPVLLKALPIAFAWLIVFHLQLMWTWAYLLLVGVFFFSSDPSHVYFAWLVVAVGVVYFLYGWAILVLNYDKDSPGPLWFRWEWDL